MTFIPFKTKPNLHYVYDMNKNSIYKITSSQYSSLKNIFDGDSDDMSILEYFQKKGLLIKPKIKEIEHPATKFLDNQMRTCVNSITFQMSQNCNLRCNYCPYSGSDLYKNRVRSEKSISWNIVQRGIDFLFENSSEADNLHIAFYGGEPLLAKDIIVQAMDYATKGIAGKNITFGMTTNGTLLDIDFLKEIENYNIAITVSLDGPSEVHDKNRYFADGNGSFNVICENIFTIKKLFPFIYDKLSINVVVTPESNHSKIFDFFRNNNELFDISKVSFNELSLNYTDRDIVYGSSYFEERNFDALKGYLALIGKLDNSIIERYKRHVEEVFSFNEVFTPINQTPSYAHPGGTCVPGLKKLFIDINGNFFPCERVNENSSLMKIGNINDGFDMSKIRKVLNVGAVADDACKNCWAFHCCSMCPIMADDGFSNHYSSEVKLEYVNI